MAYVITDKCIQCGACIDACPVGAISMQRDSKTNKVKVVINPEICISCGTCEAVCPVGAPKIDG